MKSWDTLCGSLKRFTNQATTQTEPGQVTITYGDIYKEKFVKLPSLKVFKKAYEVCARHPKRQTWYCEGGCCPLTALALYKKAIPPDTKDYLIPYMVRRWAEDTFGSDTVARFIAGVDYGHDDTDVKRYGKFIWENVKENAGEVQ